MAAGIHMTGQCHMHDDEQVKDMYAHTNNSLVDVQTLKISLKGKISNTNFFVHNKNEAKYPAIKLRSKY